MQSRFKRLSALVLVSVVAGAVVHVVPASAQTTYNIQVGQDFFEQGVPGFSGRLYPGSITVHNGDTIHFDFPIGLGPQGIYPQEHMGANDTQIGDPGNFFDFDPDEGDKALKFDLESFFGTDHPDCGTADNPCVWGPNADVIFPAFRDPPDLFVRIEAAPGTTLWGAGAPSPDVNVNFKVEVVENSAPASTQAELDERAAALQKKDYEDALALFTRMNSVQSWHRNRAGQKVYDVFVGAAAGPIEMFASFPRRTTVPEGSRVQFHFMGQIEPHTATFGGAKARDVLQNFLIPACDPDGDEGTAPDQDPTGFDEETGTPICPEGTTLEGDVHPLLPWEVGDGKVTGVNNYENSGLIFPRFPDGGSFDVNPNPWTVRFPNASPDEGFKFICLVHGGFMGGKIFTK